MVLTISAVAENKGIAVTRIVVDVEPRLVEARDGMHTTFATRLDLGDGLTHRERTILFNAAARCEVHKLLSGTIAFDQRWAEEG